MTIDDFRNGPTYVVGLHHVYPPEYLYTPGDGTWKWTHDLLSAATFPTEAKAQAVVKFDRAAASIMRDLPVEVLELSINIRKICP